MSFVYHIDRSCLLSKNQILACTNNYELEDLFNCYSNSLSAHGIRYLALNCLTDTSSFLWEIALEYVRMLKYPNYPSRFKCLFAIEKLEEIEIWKSLIGNNPHQIVKIEYYKFDARWITNPGSFHNYCNTNKFDNISFGSYCFFADKYWSGQSTNSPLWELLVELPCKCINILN